MQDTDLIYFDFIKSLRNESNDPIKGRLNPNDENFDVIKDYVKSLGLEKAKELLAQANNIRVFYDDLQQNRKRFANGLYGYVGSDFAEYTSLEVAEDITAEGRFIFKTLDVETTKLFNNHQVKTPSGVKGLLELYIDFEEIKSKFPTIVRVNSMPKSIPHFVESVEVEELKRRGKRSLPIVKEISERTYHSVVYGDTDSICISFDNVCTSFGIDIDNDDVKLVNIEQINTHISGSYLDLLGQTESFKIVGHAGVDLLKGGSGNDTFTGGAGNDIIIGGAGVDSLEGNEGADIFITADFRYNEFFDAEKEIIIADIGHYESEQFTKDLIFDLLTKNFTKFAVRLSKVNTNPIKYL